MPGQLFRLGMLCFALFDGLICIFNCYVITFLLIYLDAEKNHARQHPS